MSHPIKVGVICGGPSPERGISLNSARSILDHLASRDVTIIPFYVDVYKNFYKLSPHQLYSNTPQGQESFKTEEIMIFYAHNNRKFILINEYV